MHKLMILLLLLASPALARPPDVYPVHNITLPTDGGALIDTTVRSGAKPVRWEPSVPSCGIVMRSNIPSKMLYFPLKDPKTGALCMEGATFNVTAFSKTGESAVSVKQIVVYESGPPFYSQIVFTPAMPGSEKDSQVLSRLSAELAAEGR